MLKFKTYRATLVAVLLMSQALVAHAQLPDFTGLVEAASPAVVNISTRQKVPQRPMAANGQQKQFLGLLLLDKGVLRGHQKVVTAQGEGEITSGSFSPTLQQSIALARLPMGVQVGDDLQVDIRGKLLKAKVTKPVFARNGKAVQ